MTNEEEEKGRVVEFPPDPFEMPPQHLPDMIGRMEPGHPLKRPMTIAIIVLGILLVVLIALSIFSGPRPKPGEGEEATFSEMYREPGRITYEDKIIDGWFLDQERQHFMDKSGKRFTYVDSHEREGSPVSGYWRLVE